MIDVHCHFPGEGATRELLAGRDCVGVHPWETLEEGFDLSASLASVESRLAADKNLGVGEIGLDRLKVRDIPAIMRETFLGQLLLAAKYHRVAVLHGTKCWGKVVAECRAFAGDIPAFLFHGFSRSDGLLADIVALNGFVSVGAAVLNDHAVNYRRLVQTIPVERLLVETDRTEENAADCPGVCEIAAKVAELRGMPYAELEAIVEGNARRMLGEC